MKLRREIQITPAYDKRNPDPKKNYGIGSCRIFFSVIGDKGAVTVNFGTNWFLESTVKEYRDSGIYRHNLGGDDDSFKTKIDLVNTTEPIKAWTWDYHAKKPMYKGQKAMKGKCEFTKGKCYCDGSCLTADKFLPILLEKGSEGVFEQLEADYKTRFGAK